MYKKLYFMMFNRMTDAVNALKEAMTHCRRFKARRKKQSGFSWKAEKKANKKRPLCRKLHRGLTCH